MKTKSTKSNSANQAGGEYQKSTFETPKRLVEARKSQGLTFFRFLMRICGRVFDTTGAEYRYRLKFDQYYGIRYFYDVLVAW